jgi:hypothetical protein
MSVGDELFRLEAGCRSRRWVTAWWGGYDRGVAMIGCRIVGVGFPCPAVTIERVMRRGDVLDFWATVDEVAAMMVSEISSGGRR